MAQRTILALSFVSVFLFGAALAFGQTTQSPCPTQVLLSSPTTSKDMVCLIPQVYGPGGLVGLNYGGPLDITTGHDVHFQSSSIRSFAPINAEIGTQLSQLPFATPISGFAFAGGVVTAHTTFGPILSDRAETLGKGKIYLASSYQYFDFDKADGVNLKSFGAVFTHEPEPLVCIEDPNDPANPCVNGEPVYTKDIIGTQNRIDLKVQQITLAATAGITDKLDVSLAIPVVDVRMGIASSAVIYSFEPPPLNHYFNINGVQSSTDSFKDNGTSFGMGDITIRGKYLARQRERSALAVGIDLRLPTGDPMNFQGSGTWGFHPFLAFTGRMPGLTAHGTVGFQGNGQSVLAGDITAQTPLKEHLPDEVTYSAGVDGSLGNRIGFSFDYLGQTLLQATTVYNAQFTDYKGVIHPDLGTASATVNMASASVGGKINLGGGFLLSMNGLFRLNDAGLHSKTAPLVGLSYVF